MCTIFWLSRTRKQNMFIKQPNRGLYFFFDINTGDSL